jgi:hypothetical protein
MKNLIRIIAEMIYPEYVWKLCQQDGAAIDK